MRRILDFLFWLFLSPRGRIRRAQWWLATVLGLLIGLPSLVLIFYEELYQQYFVPLTIIDVVMLYPTFAVDAKRFQDRDRKGLWALFGIVVSVLMIGYDWLVFTEIYEDTDIEYLLVGALVVVCVWFFTDLGCARGIPGRNRFGSDPITAPLLSITQQ